MAGNERPTADEIARRAGVSTSSFFRYFEGIEDLRSQASARFVDRHRDLLEPTLPEGLDTEERVRRFVDLRIRAGVTLGPIGLRLQGRIADEPALVPMQSRVRSVLAAQVGLYLEAELSALSPARRADLTALIDSLTSLDAYRTLSETHGRSEAQVRRVWRSAIAMLLSTSAH